MTSRAGEPVFVPERNLKELILSYLKREETSISGLARRLEDDGYKLHRLLVTGYLRALSDLGYVREREIPPAKVYGLAGGRERNLYEMLGDIARDLEGGERKAVRVVIAILQRLFKRPIFLREVREAGFPSGYDALMVEEDERAEARKELMKVGIRLPLSEPAYQVKTRRTEKQEEALVRLILERFGVSGLVMETKQTRLAEKAG